MTRRWRWQWDHLVDQNTPEAMHAQPLMGALRSWALLGLSPAERLAVLVRWVVAERAYSAQLRREAAEAGQTVSDLDRLLQQTRAEVLRLTAENGQLRGYVEAARREADRYASQPTDYDEDTEAEIRAGRRMLVALGVPARALDDPQVTPPTISDAQWEAGRTVALLRRYPYQGPVPDPDASTVTHPHPSHADHLTITHPDTMRCQWCPIDLEDRPR